MLLGALGAAVLTGLTTAAATGPILRWLPEPADGDGKPTYRELATSGWCVVGGGLAALGAGVAWVCVPGPVRPLWWVLSSVGVLLVLIDARTTWLPLVLTRLGWLGMTMAVGAAVAWSRVTGGDGWPVAGRAAVGAGVALTLYWVFHWVTRGGLAFGDVRFAPLIGAASAADSWTLLVWALFLGTLVGGIHGITRLLRRRSGGFPYAPSMLAGAYLAAASLSVVRTLVLA